MEKMQFKKDINAPVEKVYEIMLGKETFKQWTAVFNPTSDFEGSWEKGSKILFVGINQEGRREGMIGYIRENIPGQYVSIEYTGVLDGDKELTTGPEVEEWQGFENYTFEGRNGTATVTVDVDINDQMIDYFRETYPKALDKLREICEA